MTTPAAGRILRVACRAAEGQRLDDLPDPDLLRRLAAGRDEAAFLAVIRRHGPMVTGVCRSVLRQDADVADAFQATFLAFALKAGSIRRAAALPGWLHGVAYRTALKIRAGSAPRSRPEPRATGPASPPDDLTWREVRQVVHEELDGLSDRYRGPLTLCYLEGRTLDQAAAQLGLAKSTLKLRLERARAVLRARLVRRGLGPAVGLLASAWPAAADGIPAGLLGPTAAAAARVAAGEPLTDLMPARVVMLAEGVRNAMLVAKLNASAAVLTAILLFGLGLTGLGLSAPPGATGREDGLKPAPTAAAERPPAEQQAIAAIQAVGGRVVFDKTQPAEPVVGVYLLSPDVNDRHLRCLKEFEGLKTLVLPEGVTDAGLKELRGLKGLERLRLGDRGFRPAALADLGRLTSLRALELDLGGVENVGPALRELRGLKNLNSLTLRAWRATGAGLEELRAFQGLRRLDLTGVRTVGPGLAVLPALSDLEELSVGGKEGSVTDVDLREVGKVKGLRVLHLTGGAVTDAGLGELRALPDLDRLLLWRTRVTDKGVAEVRKVRPTLAVTRGDGPPRTWEDFERVTGRAKVLDATTLLLDDGTRIRLLMHVPGPGEAGAKAAAAFLAGLIADRPVTCFLVEAQYAWTGYVGDVNIEHAMIINGWARSHHSGTRPAETIAREKKRGIWADK
jgi:RNA polymerase sigma factor (sigma-70 family)